MVEADRESIDILTQVASIRAALEGFGSLVLTEHVEELLSPSLGSKAANQSVTERIDEVRDVLARLLK
jgi:DNA-binding FrmR family transcriptional regulator